ncbi:MAG: arginine--tRNA ligase [Mycobacteriales bacterium]|nr:arginine--tRNA ligase [Frankia sp.]
MTPAELADVVRATVASLVDAGELAPPAPSAITVERPRQKEHGDYATNVALQLAKNAGRPPRELAESIATRLRAADGIATVDVAGPGFLNIRLDESALGELARHVVTAGDRYGHTEHNSGQRLNLEFVSANPTGPVHVGATRWAAVGDALGRLLEASGASVTREYYFNDVGGQIDTFAESLFARARQAHGVDVELPDDAYEGAYVAELAARIASDNPGVLEEPAEKAVEVFRRDGVALMVESIKASLETFRVHFDVWFLERSLHESGAVDAAVARLREHRHVYDGDGAVWLRTTDFGDDKDRVLVRSGGEPTYFAKDAAYYLDKRNRGFDRVVIMLGADHHGYIGRMRAMVACFGDNPDETLELLVGQLVNLVRGGEPVRMSKRAGNFVTLDDLIEVVGVDAARYTLARSSVDSPMDLDVDFVTRQDPENPVFYVQYAHARIASLLRHASDLGIERGDLADFDPALLSHEREAALLGSLGDFPRVVTSAATLREPHRVARYLEDLAGAYHRFYDACRVLPGADTAPDPAVTRARLVLCEATRVVLANGLALLGVTAPQRM